MLTVLKWHFIGLVGFGCVDSTRHLFISPSLQFSLDRHCLELGVAACYNMWGSVRAIGTRVYMYQKTNIMSCKWLETQGGVEWGVKITQKYVSMAFSLYASGASTGAEVLVGTTEPTRRRTAHCHSVSSHCSFKTASSVYSVQPSTTACSSILGEGLRSTVFDKHPLRGSVHSQRLHFSRLSSLHHCLTLAHIGNSS